VAPALPWGGCEERPSAARRIQEKTEFGSAAESSTVLEIEKAPDPLRHLTRFVVFRSARAAGAVAGVGKGSFKHFAC